ncbi:MAG: hypothetical protein LBH22_08475 [Bacteroidales bacterium]|jgi:hypothetical protein|nr:hypothetical protein [Bacteroidales bacterium]
MKKLFIVTATSLLLFSCGNGKQDKTSRNIEKEFKRHVAQNFDNPKSVVEIVEILPIDTFSIKRYCIEELWEKHTTAISRMNSTSDERMDYIRTKGTPRFVESLRYSTRVSINRKFDQINQNLARQRTAIERSHWSRHNLKMIIENFKNEPPVYFYQIRFRQNVNGEPQLRTFYASYTKENGKITILENFDESLEKYNGSETYFELALALKSFFVESAAYMELVKERGRLLREIAELIDGN